MLPAADASCQAWIASVSEGVTLISRRPSAGHPAAHHAFRQRQLPAEMFAVIEQRAYRCLGIVVMPGKHGFDFPSLIGPSLIGPGLLEPSLLEPGSFGACPMGFQGFCRLHQFSANGN